MTLSAAPLRSRRHPTTRSIIHVLNRIGFGPAPGDVERVRKIGLAAYIEQQLQPERIADEKIASRLAGFETLTMSTRELAQEYYLPAQMLRRQAQRAEAGAAAKPNDPAMQPGAASPGRQNRTPEEMQAQRAQRRVLEELMQQKLLRAAYSERQLQEVMVDFWFNHFNVFSGKGQTRIYLTEYERDTIRPHVFGKFRDLLGAVAESPAMLFYLDNWQSAAPEGTAMENPNGRNPRADLRRRPGQIGQRGNPNRPGMPRRPGTAGGANPTMADLPPGLQNRRPRGLNENYARELMELHTLGVDGGYTQKDVQEVARAFSGWTLTQPRQGGSFVFEPRMHDNGEKVVLGMKIKSGGGKKDGEQVLDSACEASVHREVRRDQARAPFRRRRSAEGARRSRCRDVPQDRRRHPRGRPNDHHLAGVLRACGVSREGEVAARFRRQRRPRIRSRRGQWSAARQAMRELGMPLYGCQPPTGYSDRAEAWVNTGALLNRMNFSVALASGRLRGVTAPDGVDHATIVSQALAGDLSESTRATVARATTPPQAIALVLGSPEFQRK